MAFVFELPEVGEGVVEAEVVAWKVNVGDVVRVDQPLCEITTDKAQLEISSPRAGRIVKLHGKPGDIVAVHAPLVEIEEGAAAAAPAPAAAPKAAAPAPAPAAPAAPAPAAQNGVPAPHARHRVEPPPAADRGATKATPAVRRHARELDVDVHEVPGTGKGGRVTHDDLLNFRGQESGAMPVAPPAVPMAVARPSGHEERIKIIGVRRTIANAMSASKRTKPHYTYVEEVDATELVALRKKLQPLAKDRGVSLSFMPIIMKACSVVFREFPNINANMDEEAFELVVKGDHNIGVACDTPSGLYVPVVKNVEQKSILQIAVELDDLIARTKAGKARLDELRGGTFTITGVGQIGGVLATPILNGAEVAILGVNVIRDRVVPHEGQIAIRKMMYLSPSFDHRLIDGMVGARFTAALKAVLEQPERLLLELA